MTKSATLIKIVICTFLLAFGTHVWVFSQRFYPFLSPNEQLQYASMLTLKEIGEEESNEWHYEMALYPLNEANKIAYKINTPHEWVEINFAISECETAFGLYVDDIKTISQIIPIIYSLNDKQALGKAYFFKMRGYTSLGDSTNVAINADSVIKYEEYLKHRGHTIYKISVFVRHSKYQK